MDRDISAPQSGGGGSNGDRPAVARSGRAARPPRRAKPLVEPTGDTLASYLSAIGSIPVLSREETYELAKIMEAQQVVFRSSMYAVPATARALLELWHEKQAAGRVTAALSAGYRDGSGKDWSRHVDTRMRKLERLMEERDQRGAARSGAGQKRAEALAGEIAKALGRAGFAFEILLAIYKRFESLRSAPRTRQVADERRKLGLTAPAAKAELDRAREALAVLDETKQTFVTHNLKLVVKQAKRFRNMGVPYIDLIQEGNLGLIRAVEKFEYQRGFKFSTYAVWWIEQALIRAVQNSSRTVRVPSHIYELQLRYRRIQKDLRQRLGRAPKRAELAKALGVAPEVVDRVGSSMKPITSTAATLPGTDEFTLEDALYDEDAHDPIEGIDQVELHRELEALIMDLDPREQKILAWRFGLDGEEALTLQVIGRRLGLSRERVRQLEARALRRLRQQAGSKRLFASLDLPEMEEIPEDDELVQPISFH